MRTAFIEELIRQARLRPDLFLVVGDLGFSVVEPFAAEFPERFLNAGVAEQNMTGVAAGLAAEGFHVFTYSIANFPTFRCLEQIRNDIGYHRLPVTVVAVGAGVSYGNLGYSHHALQDIAILRAFPELTLLSPADPGETRACVQWLAQNPCPSYLRLGKAGEPSLHQVTGFGPRPLKIRDGSPRAAIVCTGSILKEALDAHAMWAGKTLPPAVFSMPWLQPLDTESLVELAPYGAIFALEEHLAAGGLASLLRERLPAAVQVVSLSVPPETLGEVGSQQYLRRKSRLDAASICERILDWLGS